MSKLFRERATTGVAFNPTSAGFTRNPYPTYARLREKDAVHWSPLLGAWLVGTYADADAILRDHRRFSNYPPGGDPPWPGPGNLLDMDPPDHTRLRALVNKPFTPAEIRKLEPFIERTVDELLDEAMEAAGPSGEFDVIEAIANPLPVLVIGEMIGVPSKDRDQFKAWSNDLAARLELVYTREQEARAAVAVEELSAYFGEIIEQRRVEPAEDLISQLLAVQEADEEMTYEELIVMLIILLGAGNVTTTSLVGNGTLLLAEHPDQFADLASDPAGLAEAATEEILRYDSPVQADGRVTLEPVEYGGKQIPADRSVIVLIGAANRDETAFEAPDVFDIRRQERSHLSFGRGIHHCLGAPLARLEGQVYFRRLAERFESPRLLARPHYERLATIRGPRSLRVQLRPKTGAHPAAAPAGPAPGQGSQTERE